MRVTDETGMPRSLPEGPLTFVRFSEGAELLFLGLGPDPTVAALLAEGKPALYLECPGLISQALPEWGLAVPADFTRIMPDALAGLDLSGFTVIVYEPNQRIFPTFWGPVVAHCKRMLTGPRELGPREPVVILPADESTLLAVELAGTFTQFGLTTRRSAHGATGDQIRASLGLFTPALFLSINFKGFDAHGEVYASLAEAGINAAVWCVDNPYHLLSGLRGAFWKEMPLFVSDDWFIPGLRELGAKRVYHLPLAAGDHFFKAAGGPARFPHLENMTVFVGRPGFPDKKRFFSGLSVPEDIFNQALHRLSEGERADFGWWVDKLGVTRTWPGKDARRAGFAAEETGLIWRVMCLREAARGLPFCVFGPKDWRELLPEVDNVLSEVDYYGALAAIYRDAAFTLNLTSPLLPRGLTQRHFDVWAAGGFLLTDATPGLDLFPKELTEPVTFARPTDIALLAQGLSSDRAGKLELASAWRAEIAARHTYRHRVAAMLDILGIAAPKTPA